MCKKKLFVQGDGKSKRNFIYKKDFCEAIYKLITIGKINNIYHFSGKNLISIKKLIVKICKLMNYDFNKLVKYTSERSSLDKIYKLNTRKTEQKLGWKTDYSLDEGLNNTINFIRKNFYLIKKERLEYIHKK